MSFTGLDGIVGASFLFRVAAAMNGMTVRVLLFASYADALGRPELNLELPAGARVRDVLARVKEMASGKRVPAKPLVAVNQRYASEDQQVDAADEVAIIPPVAGG